MIFMTISIGGGTGGGRGGIAPPTFKETCIILGHWNLKDKLYFTQHTCGKGLMNEYKCIYFKASSSKAANPTTIPKNSLPV